MANRRRFVCGRARDHAGSLPSFQASLIVPRCITPLVWWEELP